VRAVDLMTDADNSCQRAAAEYADFRFVGPKPEAESRERKAGGPTT
jgi:hypothetical protein